MNVKSQDKNLAEIQAQWVTVRGRIRQKIGDAQFKSWIKVLVFEDYDECYETSTKKESHDTLYGTSKVQTPKQLKQELIVSIYLNLMAKDQILRQQILWL